MAQLVYDVTVRFCDRYMEKRSRTHDQMVQAARSGVQNIAEGSQASGTSKKMELKPTNVARASLEELRLDDEDFLRHRKLTLWPADDPRRRQLVDRRWVKAMFDGRDGRYGPDGPGKRDDAVRFESTPPSPIQEIAANAAHALIGVACVLLDRQIESLARAFEEEGGFAERLHRVRSARRRR